MPLDVFLYYLADGVLESPPPAGFNDEAPPIYVVESPTFLLFINGEPVATAVGDTGLEVIGNANFPVFPRHEERQLLPALRRSPLYGGETRGSLGHGRRIAGGVPQDSGARRIRVDRRRRRDAAEGRCRAGRHHDLQAGGDRRARRQAAGPRDRGHRRPRVDREHREPAVPARRHVLPAGRGPLVLDEGPRARAVEVHDAVAGRVRAHPGRRRRRGRARFRARHARGASRRARSASAGDEDGEGGRRAGRHRRVRGRRAEVRADPADAGRARGEHRQRHHPVRRQVLPVLRGHVVRRGQADGPVGGDRRRARGGLRNPAELAGLSGDAGDRGRQTMPATSSRATTALMRPACSSASASRTTAPAGTTRRTTTAVTTTRTTGSYGHGSWYNPNTGGYGSRSVYYGPYGGYTLQPGLQPEDRPLRATSRPPGTATSGRARAAPTTRAPASRPRPTATTAKTPTR